MASIPETRPASNASPRYPFRRAVLRGLAIVLPPLLTVVIFLWVGSTVQMYVLRPVKEAAREILVWSVSDIREAQGEKPFINGREYTRLDNGQYVPSDVLDVLDRELPAPEAAAARSTAYEAYRRYVELRFLQDYLVIPVFLLCFVLFLYLLGKSLAAGFGAFFWNIFERGISQLPLVRTVYRSSKQVTNFMFNKGDIKFNRVVAVEYPRDNMWTVGLVTGEGMRDINSALGEETVSVMLPCSPMPVTGYAVVVPVSKTIPLNMSIDQALQFIVSCGVVGPRAALLTTADSEGDAADRDLPGDLVAGSTPPSRS